MNADETVLDHLTRLIIGRAMTVSNGLGTGFLEKVYENALAHELRKGGVDQFGAGFGLIHAEISGVVM